MALGPIKSFVLAPGFHYHVNTSICVGNVIQNPGDPTKPLCRTISDSEQDQAKLESHIDCDVELGNKSSASLRGNIWARFLESVQARVGGGTSGDLLDKYTITRLETVYFREQPTDEEAEKLVKDTPKLQAVMDAGIMPGKRPVFMITGLKVARGFRLRSERAAGVFGKVAAEAPILNPVLDAGVDISGHNSKSTETRFRAAKGQDIVFAYQLHVIAYKGWRNRHVDISMYKPKGGFLNNEREKVAKEPVGVEVAGVPEVSAFYEEMPVHEHKAMDGGEECVCIVFDKFDSDGDDFDEDD